LQYPAVGRAPIRRRLIGDKVEAVVILKAV
jgi:hypothetical protein